MVTLDHVGIAGHDLNSLAATYEALGFTLTPFARHAGKLTPDGPTVPFGTGNRCAMLGRPGQPAGYLELIARVDPNAPANSLDRFLQRYAGIHIVAFGISDEEAELARLRREGFDLPGVAYLERPVDQDDPAKGTAKFARLPLPADASPEGRMQLIRHLTAEKIWRDGWLQHPNRAVALSGLVLCVADVDEAAARFARLTGVAPRPAAGQTSFRLGDATMTLIGPKMLGAILPGVDPPSLPFIAGVLLTTDDRAEAISRIAGPRATRHGQFVQIAPDHAGGCALLFQ